MGNKLEQLLNSLIEKGRLPRWEDKIHSCRYYEEEKKFKADYTIAWIPQVLYRSIRELCSREAGLWQFVCENGMIYSTPDDRWWPNYNWLEDLFNCWWKHPDYWLMESALCDEYKLEDFLLQNIKIDE